MLLRSLLFAFCCQLASLSMVAQKRADDFYFPATAPHIVNVSDADPFDIETGIYYREYTDLFVPDTIPIKFVRTQRSMDSRSRSFGVGSSTSYDMFIIGDVQKFSWVALVLADGGQIRFTRISPGTGYADGVFENRATPGEFRGARISWNGRNAWTVIRPDGMGYTVQGCNANSKPGQCAVTEIMNRAGARLTIQRDRDGNILRITAPHGRFVIIEHDGKGRITKASDDSGRWVQYSYNPQGCLETAVNSQGDKQEFGYNAHLNMTFVHESSPKRGRTPAYDLTVNNKYDDHDRFQWQKISDGRVFSVKYVVTSANGDIRQADVYSPDGLSKYFFNEAGYEYRHQFRPGTRFGWVLELSRDPHDNSVSGMTLTCNNNKASMTLRSYDDDLIESADERRSRLSKLCKTEPKAPPR
jgi:YD repeat-containing protein